MAGNSEKDNRSLGGKVKEKVMSWFTPNATEADKVVVQQLGEISLCLCCYQPMLTTYDGCTACKEFKVFPGVCKLPSCANPRYFDGCTRRVHDFCGRTHATEYKNMVQGHQGRGHGQTSSYVGYGYQGYSAAHNYNHVHNTRAAAAHHNGPIHFYNRDEPYYEFTNFYEGEVIVLDDTQWRTSEHYFQAQKFVGTPYVEWIRRLERPREAFDISRNPSVSRWRRSDWEQVKIGVMRKVLLAKFTQNDRLRWMLLNTGDRRLVEHTHRDSFWGDGGDGSGQNNLGNLLMQVRSELRGRLSEGTPVDKEQVKVNRPTHSVMGDATNKRLKTDSAEDTTPPGNDEHRHQPEETGKDQKTVTNDEKKDDNEPSEPPVDKLVDLDDVMDITPPLPSFPSHLLTDASPLVATPRLGFDDGKKEGMQSEPPHGVPDGQQDVQCDRRDGGPQSQQTSSTQPPIPEKKDDNQQMDLS